MRYGAAAASLCTRRAAIAAAQLLPPPLLLLLHLPSPRARPLRVVVVLPLIAKTDPTRSSHASRLAEYTMRRPFNGRAYTHGGTWLRSPRGNFVMRLLGTNYTSRTQYPTNFAPDALRTRALLSEKRGGAT